MAVYLTLYKYLARVKETAGSVYSAALSAIFLIFNWAWY